MMNTSHVKDIFREFEPELLQDIEEKGQIKTIPAGTDLMRKGQFIRSTGLVLSGLVKVFREDEEGNEFFMYHLLPGEACAMSMHCLIGQMTSTVSATAVKETEMLMIPLEQMEEWMSRYKSWYHFVIRSYRNRFEELLNVLDQVAFRNMDERLESYLNRQCKNLGTNLLHTTHQDIAQDLNSSREVISRLLKKMAERGKVIISRNSIEVLGT